MTLQDIIRMMGADPKQAAMGQVSNAEIAAMGGLSSGIPSAAANPARKMSPLEQVRKAMEARQLSLPAAEGMPNYANNEMPLYTGGLLENMQGQAVDPQQLLNTAYDMSAPREMRINAIERLRALGVI